MSASLPGVTIKTMSTRYFDPKNDPAFRKVLDAARNEGVKHGRIEIAKKMLSQGFTVDQVISISELSPEDVLELQNELVTTI